MSALVSCVVPVHDGERFLGAALDSILGQTHREVEAIVVDDGSTDGTPAVIASFGDRIRSVRQENAGHAAARNHGIELARGAFLAFLDADDLWHPEKLAQQLARFAERPELEVCFSGLRNFRDGSDAVEDVPGYTSVTLLARRVVFERVGSFDPSLRHGNDRDWMLRASEAGTVMELLPEVLVYRRLHDANRSLRLADASRAEYLRIVKASLDRRRASGQELSHDFGTDPEA
jgi:glycosyltransferase involved in cell wall biosynthesis